MLKIISWNIRQGGGSRIRKIMEMLLHEKPSVIVLSEYRNNHSGLHIRQALLKHNYRFQICTAARPNDNSVLIASKFACNGLLYPDADEVYADAIAEAEFPAFRLWGMYLPHKKKHRLFQFLFKELQSDDKPAILTGDLNTGLNFIDQKGNSFWYSEHLKKLETIGYVDAFRAIHGDKKEFSWFSHQGNGFRYDHSYIHESMLPILKDCYYIHAWRQNGISDHSAMVVELA